MAEAVAIGLLTDPTGNQATQDYRAQLLAAAGPRNSAAIAYCREMAATTTGDESQQWSQKAWLITLARGRFTEIVLEVERAASARADGEPGTNPR